jgi:hypothetical protein
LQISPSPPNGIPGEALPRRGDSGRQVAGGRDPASSAPWRAGPRRDPPPPAPRRAARFPPPTDDQRACDRRGRPAASSDGRIPSGPGDRSTAAMPFTVGAGDPRRAGPAGVSPRRAAAVGGAARRPAPCGGSVRPSGAPRPRSRRRPSPPERVRPPTRRARSPFRPSGWAIRAIGGRAAGNGQEWCRIGAGAFP